MKFVRTFFIVALMVGPPMSGPGAEPVALSLPACSLQLPMAGPTKTLKRGNGWVILKREYPGKPGARMIARCKPNAHHTSLISDLRDIARKRMQVLRYYREIKIHQSVPAVYYLKSRVHRGRRVISIDAYFATREHEYNFNFIPDKRAAAGTRMKEYEYLVGDMGAILRDLRFTKPVRPAITEAAYRRRVNWLIFGAAAMVLALLFFLYIRRRRKTTVRKEREKKDKAKDKEKSREEGT